MVNSDNQLYLIMVKRYGEPYALDIMERFKQYKRREKEKIYNSQKVNGFR